MDETVVIVSWKRKDSSPTQFCVVVLCLLSRVDAELHTAFLEERLTIHAAAIDLSFRQELAERRLNRWTTPQTVNEKAKCVTLYLVS